MRTVTVGLSTGLTAGTARSFRSWNAAVCVALANAHRDGYRWRVRHSHAYRGRWLVARIVPNQRINAQ